MKLSIVIVNWNTRELLLNCLGSLRRHAPTCTHEVIVVDNASPDGSAQAVAANHPEVRLLALDHNTGYARGNNVGIESAQGEYLLTLNPDTEFEDESLDRAISKLDTRKDVAAIAVRLIGFEGETQRSVRGFPSIAGILGQITGLARRFPGSAWDNYVQNSFDYEAEGYADQPMGTFLMFRRDALDLLVQPTRPFDESFPIYFNEVDLLKRLADRGRRCWYLPDAHVRHLHGASTRQVRRSMIWESHNSLVRYFEKHLRGVARLGLPVLAAVLFVTAFLRAKGYDAGFRPQHHDL